MKAPGEAAQAVLAALPPQVCDERAGERIRKRRKKMGLTQRDLASRGCSVADLSRVERGLERPSLELLLRLALVLDISPIYLAWDRGKKERGARETRFALLFLGVPENQLDAAYARQRALKGGPS